jgi:hypothetical protein
MTVTFTPGILIPRLLRPGVTTRLAARCFQGHGSGARRR